MNRDEIQLILNRIFIVRPDLKSVRKIEMELGMGAGTLAKAMKRQRDLPEKWILPLQVLANPSVMEEAKKKLPQEVRMVVDVKALVTQHKLQGAVFDAPEIDQRTIIDELTFQSPKPWIKEIERFCELHNCTPQDLMNNYIVKQVKKPSTDWMKDLEG